MKEQRSLNPEKYKEINKKLVKKRRLPHNWRDIQRNKDLIWAFGITLEDYKEKLAQQGGGCAICKTTTPRKNAHYFMVDHDHKTGKVRGLLCGSCNSALGLFKDNSDILLTAAEYLNGYRSN